MSTGLLYHAWGIRGYRHVRTTYPKGGIGLGIEKAPGTFRCAICGSSGWSSRDGWPARSIRCRWALTR